MSKCHIVGNLMSRLTDDVPQWYRILLLHECLKFWTILTGVAVLQQERQEACLSFFLLFCTQLTFDLLLGPSDFLRHAGKRLTSWLSFVMSNCEVVTFSLVSWVRCGA